ncbi:unnamed protein product [Pylaiella littoralis]
MRGAASLTPSARRPGLTGVKGTIQRSFFCIAYVQAAPLPQL